MANVERMQVDLETGFSIVSSKPLKPPPPPPKKVYVTIPILIVGICFIGVAGIAILDPGLVASIPVLGDDLARLASGETRLLASTFGAAGGLLSLAGLTGKREYVVAPLLYAAIGLALEVASVVQAGTGFANASSLWLPAIATVVFAAGWLLLTPSEAEAH